jgi:hypothetical protein
MKYLLHLIIALAICIVPVFVQAQDSTAKTEEKPAVKSEASAAGIQVLDAKLGKDIKDKEISEEAAEFDLNAKVWFWVKVKGAANESLTITWKCGDLTKESKLNVTSSPFRTWTAKNVAKAGDWTVTVADASGNTLKELKFTVK